MNDEQLAKELEAYKNLAKEDKRIDVSALMLNALQKHENNMLTPKEKRIGYLVSLALPPIGLIYGLKFYMSGKDDAKEAAVMCAVLTIFSLLLGIVFINVMFSGSGTSIDQVKTIKPSDIQQLYQ